VGNEDDELNQVLPIYLLDPCCAGPRSPQHLVSPAGYDEILRLLRMLVEWLLPKRLLTEWLLAPAAIALHTVAELLRLSIEVSACC
jgi:hypothetical protein